MFDDLLPFLLHWGLTALSLWLASLIFKGVRFDNGGSLAIAALLLGLANAVVKPLLLLLTFPLTLLTFGLFILVINALMLLLVSSIIKGFKLSGFWTAFFAGLFISVLSILFGAMFSASPETTIEMPSRSVWL